MEELEEFGRRHWLVEMASMQPEQTSLMSIDDKSTEPSQYEEISVIPAGDDILTTTSQPEQTSVLPIGDKSTKRDTSDTN